MNDWVGFCGRVLELKMHLYQMMLQVIVLLNLTHPKNKHKLWTVETRTLDLEKNRVLPVWSPAGMGRRSCACALSTTCDSRSSAHLVMWPTLHPISGHHYSTPLTQHKRRRCSTVGVCTKKVAGLNLYLSNFLSILLSKKPYKLRSYSSRSTNHKSILQAQYLFRNFVNLT